MDVLASKAPANPQFKLPPPYEPPVDEDAIEEAARVLGASVSPMILLEAARKARAHSFVS